MAFDLNAGLEGKVGAAHRRRRRHRPRGRACLRRGRRARRRGRPRAGCGRRDAGGDEQGQAYRHRLRPQAGRRPRRRWSPGSPRHSAASTCWCRRRRCWCGGRASFDVSEADWDIQHDVNLKASFFLAQAAARLMRDQGRGGRIINFTSQGWQSGGFGGSVAYAASKGGIVSMTRGLARTLAKDKITVNAVSPGAADTAMMRSGMDDAALASTVAQIPLGYMAHPSRACRHRAVPRVRPRRLHHRRDDQRQRRLAYVLRRADEQSFRKSRRDHRRGARHRRCHRRPADRRRRDGVLARQAGSGRGAGRRHLHRGRRDRSGQRRRRLRADRQGCRADRRPGQQCRHPAGRSGRQGLVRRFLGGRGHPSQRLLPVRLARPCRAW